jgi:DNA repair protein RecO (recombination protein O)
VIDWTDDGFVLGMRRYGETGAGAELFTRMHGRFAAWVHGGAGRRMTPVLQTGNLVRATWKARLNDQLGHFAPIELLEPYAAHLLSLPEALAAVTSASAMIRGALPERQGYPAVYDALSVVVEALGDIAVWPALYTRFELGLLSASGYGVDLSRCAVTGAEAGLAFVSPRTGRAATFEAGAPHADKLLRLPPYFVDPDAPIEEGDVADGFALCGHFFERRVFDPKGEHMPEPRRRLIERLGFAGRL